MPIRAKHVYDPPAADDGYRVLVDRLWPRGVRKAEAAVDAWLKELAPSTPLRHWFGHDPDKWPEFKRRYFKELETRHAALADLGARARHDRVTLLFAARESRYNNAVALKEYLEKSFCRREAARH